MKLTDHLHIREIEAEAKAPYVFLSNINEVTQFSDDLPNFVDQFINQLKAHALCDQFLAQTPTNEPDIPFTGFFLWCKSRKPTELEPMILSVLSDLPTGSQPLGLRQEQQIDEVIRELILCKNGGSPDQSPIFPIALRRYRKQFDC